jgi:hypothetical protein
VTKLQQFTQHPKTTIAGGLAGFVMILPDLRAAFEGGDPDLRMIVLGVLFIIWAWLTADRHKADTPVRRP